MYSVSLLYSYLIVWFVLVAFLLFPPSYPFFFVFFGACTTVVLLLLSYSGELYSIVLVSYHS